jgi:dienelactone hydrolase
MSCIQLLVVIVFCRYTIIKFGEKKMRKLTQRMILPLVLVWMSLFSNNLFSQSSEFTVVSKWLKYSNMDNVLYNTLNKKAFTDLDIRANEVGRLSTAAQWESRQEKVRKLLKDAVGEFPQKTPLNAKVVDVIVKKDYKVEKIIFESQPKFYVTAAMFIPKGLKEKTPAVIYCSGHSDIAYRNDTYQGVILNLVKKGFIVLAFDPIGQGERMQYYDESAKGSNVGGPTREHSYCGAQCFLGSSTLANYMIWDGIRVVDYLLTRKEVDKDRIGITGRSGGGTQSAYIAAFDDRIKAVATECYVTSYKRLLESIGPQDAEQNFYHGIMSGLDFADLLEVRAPKPALLITTTRDMFSIQGARETAQEIESVYKVFGKESDFYKIEDDDVHASTLKNREGMYAFFQKYLNFLGEGGEQKMELLSLDELKNTKTGQISSSIGGQTVFDLQLLKVQGEIDDLEKRRDVKKDHLEFSKMVKNVLGYEEAAAEGKVVFCGRIQRDAYVIEKYFIENKDLYPIPFLVMKPENKKSMPVLLYLNPKGKGHEAGVGQEMEWFVKKGYMVIAPDLPGYGELGKSTFRGDAFDFKQGKADYNTWFLSIQTGESITAIQLQYLSRLLYHIKLMDDVSGGVSAVAKGDLCTLLAHGAIIRGDISKIALINPLISYREIVENRYYLPHFIPEGIGGMLKKYDLPDIYANFAPKELLVVGMVNHIGEKIDIETNKELEYVKKSYKGTNNMLHIKTDESVQNREKTYMEWITIK